jgi:hypothetical protein
MNHSLELMALGDPSFTLISVFAIDLALHLDFPSGNVDLEQGHRGNGLGAAE